MDVSNAPAGWTPLKRTEDYGKNSAGKKFKTANEWAKYKGKSKGGIASDPNGPVEIGYRFPNGQYMTYYSVINWAIQLLKAKTDRAILPRWAYSRYNLKISINTMSEQIHRRKD